MSPSGRIDKRAEMEARMTLRSKSASKAEKEAAAKALAESGDVTDSDGPSGLSAEAPQSKGAARAARRQVASVQRRGSGRGR